MRQISSGATTRPTGAGLVNRCHRVAALFRRHDSIWAMLLVGVVVVLAATYSIERLHRSAIASHRAELILVEIDQATTAISAAEWQAIAERRLDDQSHAAIEALCQDLTARLAELLAVRQNGDSAREVQRAAAAYEQLIDREVEALFAGDFAEARRIDIEAVDPAFDALRDLLAETRADYRAHGRRADLIAGIGAVVTLMMVVESLVVLSWKLQRSRKAAVRFSIEQQVLRASETRFRALVQHATDVILLIDRDGVVRHATPSAERIWGTATAQLIECPLIDLVISEDRAVVRALADQLSDAPRTVRTIELRCRHADGRVRDLEVIAVNLLADPVVAAIVLTCHDLTERKAFERQLTAMAFHDALTGLPNRALFLDRLEHALTRADHAGPSLTVMFLDLDNFKIVNDSLGHASGDRLLVTVAAGLQAVVGTEGTVARLGGDEFILLLEYVTDLAVAARLAERLAEAIRQPIPLDGHEIVVTASIGITRGIPGHDRPEQLLRDADLAMYGAKAHGKARVQVFEPSMGSGAVVRLELEADLRQALVTGELRVHYQPIVSLSNGCITELEALVRWQHPTRGLIGPGHFIPLAEESGLIIAVGRWVLNEACVQTRRWQLSLPDNRLSISVNLSARQFQSPSLVADVARALQTSGLAPSSLKLEITEGIAMADAEAAVVMLHELRALGVRLAIDDFGTGYSSLSYLKRFPVDTLKVDRSFIEGLGHDRQDAAIMRSIVALAHSLSLDVTAEGVETITQWEQVRLLGCDSVQGYLLAWPQAADAAGELLRAGRMGPRAVA